MSQPKDLKFLSKQVLVKYIPPFLNGDLTYHPFVGRAFEKFIIEKCPDGAFIRYAAVHFRVLFMPNQHRAVLEMLTL